MTAEKGNIETITIGKMLKLSQDAPIQLSDKDKERKS